jgi:PleD family two-component response regulator
MKRVLVADTDVALLGKIRNWLGTDFRVSEARNAKAAFQMACEQRPDLILLGYLEPRGESFNLHKELREREDTASIPLLVIDVAPQEHSRKGWRRIEGLQMDAEGYLCRPLEAQLLQTEVARALDGGSAGMLSWARVLEQTEKALLREMNRWNGGRSQPGQSPTLQPERRQPAALRA